MQTVNHKEFGIGEVVNKKYEGNNIYITVKFDGKEPFELSNVAVEKGIITVDGSLKEEFDKVIEENKARRAAEAKKSGSYIAAPVATAPAPAPRRRSSKGTASKVSVKSVTEGAYEDYLISAGSREFTDKGNPSTVYSYAKGIGDVLEEEHLTWEGLKNSIDTIIPVYDVGGRKQDIGNKSNKTVINALRRFKEFVED